jgi:crotonobetainyl-CoA:carnitine CoA-transferase CaiB-like acyl-CoA transferase
MSDKRDKQLMGTDSGGPLNGVRVVETCWVWSGPLLGQLLADLGAEVIKCEWYRRFDPYRTRGVERLRGLVPEQRRRESSQSFHSLNRNKLGLAVDLKDENGIEVVKDLLRHSDLLIENFTVGTLARLGLGDEVLRELNPDLVALSLSGFGAGSRLERMRAYGLVLSALGGGEADIEADGEFVGSPTFVVSDPNASLFGLYAAVAALLRARRGGGGGALRGSQLEGIVSLVQMAREDAGEHWEELTVEAADGVYVAVSIPAGAALDAAAIRERARRASAARLLEELAAAGIGAAPVLDVAETADHELFADLAVRIGALHPVSGPEELVAAPWRVDGHRADLRKPAPVLGESDDYVLSQVIGYPDEEVGRRRRPEPPRAAERPSEAEAPGID